MNDNQTVNRLFWTIALAVVLIALGSFVWSFLSLWELASANSNQAGLGWIWPLVVDTSMCIYTGAILVAQLQRRPARLPIGLTVFYALVTVAGNVLHAPGTYLGWFVAILPPLSLIFGTEMLRSMGQHIIERQTLVQSLSELGAQRDNLSAEVSKLWATFEQATGRLEQVKNELKAANFQQKAASIEEMNARRFARIEQRREKVLSLLGDGLSESDIAGELGVTVKTIKRDLVALNGKVKVTL